MRLFSIFLFHESNTSGPLINRLKWLCLKICFRGDIGEEFDSAQANTVQSRTPGSVSQRVESGILIFENPKLANTVWSRTLHRLTQLEPNILFFYF